MDGWDNWVKLIIWYGWWDQFRWLGPDYKQNFTWVVGRWDKHTDVLIKYD